MSTTYKGIDVSKWQAEISSGGPSSEEILTLELFWDISYKSHLNNPK